MTSIIEKKQLPTNLIPNNLMPNNLIPALSFTP